MAKYTKVHDPYGQITVLQLEIPGKGAGGLPGIPRMETMMSERLSDAEVVQNDAGNCKSLNYWEIYFTILIIQRQIKKNNPIHYNSI